jgi:DNA-binding NtrC family response regulator
MVIEKAFQRAPLQRESRLLRHKQTEQRPIKLIGQSKKMDQVRYLIRQVATTDEMFSIFPCHRSGNAEKTSLHW